MLGPKAKKEIFGHHRMWKKSLSQEPQCLLVCSQYAPPRPPTPTHIHTSHHREVGRPEPAATLSPPQPYSLLAF